MTTSEDSARLSILIAEDDRVMSDVIRFNLERAGHQTTVARSGTEAWQMLQTQPFDLLITDYQMPGMTGEDVCRAIRRDVLKRHMPVIMLSAKGMELNVARLKEELAIDHVLFKPFSPRNLVQVVARTVATGDIVA